MEGIKDKEEYNKGDKQKADLKINIGKNSNHCPQHRMSVEKPQGAGKSWPLWGGRLIDEAHD